MSANTQQSRLKELIAKGKEQGYLTYAQVNDHLPDDIANPDQVEDIIRMINDIGIPVSEVAPDGDSLFMSDAADDAAAEEAAAALALVDSDVGRTTDPVRMYMREMGTVELLTREGEIVIAKRIEEGIREVMSALAYFPGAVQTIMNAFKEAEEDPNRVGDIFSGFIDPSDEDPEPGVQAGAAAPVADDTSDSDSDGDDDDDSDTESEDSGIDLTEVIRRFDEIRDANIDMVAAIEKHGRASKQAEEAISRLAELFAPIKLTPKHFEALVNGAREALVEVRPPLVHEDGAALLRGDRAHLRSCAEGGTMPCAAAAMRREATSDSCSRVSGTSMRPHRWSTQVSAASASRAEQPAA